MALKTVNWSVRGPDGSVKAGAQITVKLSQPATLSGTSEVVPSTVILTTDSTGAASAQLQANNDLTPTGTFYSVTEAATDGGTFGYTMVVPQTAGPFNAASIMTGVAPTASPQVGHLSSLTVDAGLTVTAAPVSLPAASLTEANVANLTSDLASKANDAAVVHLAGAETITGIKTFSANPILNAGALPLSAVTGAAADSAVVHLAGAETITGAKVFSGGLTSHGAMVLDEGSNAGVNTVSLSNGSGHFALNVTAGGINVAGASGFGATLALNAGFNAGTTGAPATSQQFGTLRVVKATAGQSTDLTQWVGSDGTTVLAKVDVTGALTITSQLTFAGGAYAWSPNGDGTLRFVSPSGSFQFGAGAMSLADVSAAGLTVNNTTGSDNLGAAGLVVNFTNNISDSRWSAVSVTNSTAASPIQVFRLTPHGALTLKPYTSGDVPLTITNAMGAATVTTIDSSGTLTTSGSGIFSGNLAVAGNVLGPATSNYWGLRVGAAGVGNSAAAEAPIVTFNGSATLTVTGAIATQRFALFNSTTITAASPQTITNAATLAIAGAPIPAGSATITNAMALWAQSGKAQFDGDVQLAGAASKFGAYGGPGVVKQTVTGAKGGNAALASLLTALSSMGLLTDSTT